MQKFRVLVVDDHTMVRRGLAELLRAEVDIEVVGEAGDAQEGMALAHELNPDVILMDVSMPGTSGVEATRRVKADMPRIRIIGVSMHDMDGTRESMLRAGADDYVTKDAPPEELLAAVRSSGAPTE
ncbi:MAG: response regulator transcription factor [Candidatus Brocadiia bacterium]